LWKRDRFWLKITKLFELKIYFSVSFDQCSASLLNNLIDFEKECILVKLLFKCFPNVPPKEDEQRKVLATK